ncbi:MAG TPA: ribosome maturation factor RimM [Edaphobacter sp.]|nr:ribosome maturation factor RimM [Edaphobacter sp.]
MTNSSPPWIVLAHLLRPQGRKGELLAELLTDFPERFEGGRRVFLAAPNFAGNESEAQPAEVVAFWLPTGKNEGRIVLHFAGVETISAAELLAGRDVIVSYEERVPLDDESTYISDLIGCTVYDGATAVGVIDDVQFPATADGGRRLEEAVPLLAVTSPDGEEILIPFAKAFLIAVDTAAKRVDMVLPSGLVDVNRSAGDHRDQA